MKKNLYYRSVFKHENEMKNNFMHFIIMIASPFCSIIEVFIRKNMGRRYFKLSTSVILIIFMLFYLVINLVVQKFAHDTMSAYYRGYETETSISIISWTVFLIIFGYFSYKRSKETKLLQSEFDMNHFSLSNGDPLPFFTNLKIKGKPASIRTIEVIIEPLAVFIAGLVLMIAGLTMIGGILTNCAILYSLRSYFAYQIGDNFILDKIDEMICNEDLSKNFIEDEIGDRGFQYSNIKPNSKIFRGVIYNMMIENEDFTDAV